MGSLWLMVWFSWLYCLWRCLWWHNI